MRVKRQFVPSGTLFETIAIVSVRYRGPDQVLIFRFTFSRFVNRKREVYVIFSHFKVIRIYGHTVLRRTLEIRIDFFTISAIKLETNSAPNLTTNDLTIVVVVPWGTGTLRFKTNKKKSFYHNICSYII